MDNTRCKKLINKKSEAYKKFRMGQISREENNRIKNEMSSKINKAKHEFYKNSFELFNGNIKKSWGLLNELMKKTKSKRADTHLIVDTKKIVEPYAVANTFAKYFSSVGNTLENSTEINTLITVTSLSWSIGCPCSDQDN